MTRIFSPFFGRIDYFYERKSRLNDIKRSAIIYTRLASIGQDHGKALAAQEAQCGAFATDKDYSVLKKFHDEGVGANDIERPGLNAMIKYLESIDNAENHVVIAKAVQRLGQMSR